jgi:hypothetical protein
MTHFSDNLAELFDVVLMFLIAAKLPLRVEAIHLLKDVPAHRPDILTPRPVL